MKHVLKVKKMLSPAVLDLTNKQINKNKDEINSWRLYCMIFDILGDAIHLLKAVTGESSTRWIVTLKGNLGSEVTMPVLNMVVEHIHGTG